MQIQVELAGFTAEEVCRVLVDELRTCLVVCAASATGFGGAFPSGSRLLLDRFEECWRRTFSLHDSFRTAAEAFRDFTRAALDDYDLAGLPQASVVAAVVSRGRVHCGWLGGCEAFLVENGHCLEAIEPDTMPVALARPCEQNGFQPIVGDHVRNALWSSISAEMDSEQMRSTRWKLSPGGRVILADYQYPRPHELTGILDMLDGQGPYERPRYCVISCSAGRAELGGN